MEDRESDGACEKAVFSLWGFELLSVAGEGGQSEITVYAHLVK